MFIFIFMVMYTCSRRQDSCIWTKLKPKTTYFVETCRLVGKVRTHLKGNVYGSIQNDRLRNTASLSWLLIFSDNYITPKWNGNLTGRYNMPPSLYSFFRGAVLTHSACCSRCNVMASHVVVTSPSYIWYSEVTVFRLFLFTMQTCVMRLSD
jgi:hypothetical protein